MITKSIKLYLGDGFPVRIPVSQFDTMWQFVFEIIHNSQPWQIPTGATAVLNGRKPDGNVFAFSGTIENNTVTVDADVQMTAVAGQTVCELSILANNKTVGTANFILDVEDAPKSADDVVSDTVLDGYGMMVTNAVDDYIERHPEVFGGDKFTTSAKNALLALLEKVAYIDENGQTYIDALESELFPPASIVSITAVFNQGQNVIYETDSLDSLKQYLTVTASYDDGSSSAVSGYTLSGELAVGTSTITILFDGKTTTFDATVTAVIYHLENRTFNNDGGINTQLKVLETDRNISMVFDADFAGQLGNNAIWKLFNVMNSNSPWHGVALQAADDSAKVIWMTKSAPVPIARSYIGNVKIVITHAVGSGSMKYYYKVGSANMVSGTLTEAFSSITNTLRIGGAGTTAQPFNGTVNRFVVYDSVISAARINEFIKG